MELWEQQAIRRNLVKLQKSTICSSILLNFLISDEIISEEDCQHIILFALKIFLKLKNAAKTEIEKAATLYNILMTRKNAFQVLMNGLSETSQSGALCILQTEHLKFESEKFNNVRSSVIQTSKYDYMRQCLKCVFRIKYVFICLAAITCPLFFGITPNQNSVNFIIENFDIKPSVIQLLIESSLKTINQPDTNGATLLHRAVYFGRNVETIITLINLGADWKIKDNQERTVLHYAAEGGNQEAFQYFKSIGADVNAVEKLGETPIHRIRFTRHKNYYEMTNFLIQNDADINSRSRNGSTLAHLISLPETVTTEDFQNWAKSIIKAGHGKLFAARNNLGRTPLHNAVWRLDLDKSTIHIILNSANITVDEKDANGATILHKAVFYGRKLETIKSIIQIGADWKNKNYKGLGVMHYAVMGNNNDAILYFQSLGADINEIDNDGETPLHKIRFTYTKEFLELASFLFQIGADLYSTNKFGDTLTHQFGHSDYVTSNDFRIWVTNVVRTGHSKIFTIAGQKGRTPLHTAVLKIEVDLDLLKLVINSANLGIDQPDNNGNTILHIALNGGRSLQMIKNLLNLGADWRKKCLRQGGVMHHAIIGGNREAFLYFKSLGADVNEEDSFGETPFHKLRFTRLKDYLEMTRFLLENGANPYATDKYGNNAAQLFYSGEKVTNQDWQSWKDYMVRLGYESLFADESNFKREIL